MSTSLQFGDQAVPFGTELLLRCRQMPLLVMHVEICEDLWVPLQVGHLSDGSTLRDA